MHTKDKNKPKSKSETSEVATGIPKPKWQHIMIIVILGFLVYSNSLNNPFMYDDIYNIVDNSFIKNFKNISDLFTSKYFSLAQEKTYRPVVTLSYFIDYSLWGLNVTGWHITNIVFHVINAILFYLLILMIIGNLKISLISALLFCAHPIQTEVINIVSFREDLISLLFFILSLIFYVKYSKNNEKYISYIIYSICFFSIAVFSKEMALTLPLILILYDYLFMNDDKVEIKRYLFEIINTPRYWGYYAVILFVFVQRNYLIKPVGYVMLRDITTHTNYPGGNIFTAVLTTANTIVYYMGLLIVPIRLCIDHALEVSSTLNPMTIISIILVISIIVYAIIISERSKNISFSILYFFICLIPVSNIIPIGAIIAERYLYFSSIGFCLLLGIFSANISINNTKYSTALKNTSYLMLIILIGFYGIRTYIRNNDYKDEIILWSKNLKVYPKSDRALSNLGNAYLNKGYYDESIICFNKLVSIDPNIGEIYNARGAVYLKKDLIDEAILDFTKAIELIPIFSMAYSNRGMAYFSKKSNYEALNDLNKAIELDPNNISAYKIKGCIYTIMEFYDKAILDFNKVIELNSNDYESYNYRGIVFGKKGLFDRALSDFNNSIQLNPGFYEARNNKRLTLNKMKGDSNKSSNNNVIEEDNKLFKEAISRIIFLIEKEKLDDALAQCNKLIETNPGVSEIYNKRGVIYAMKSNYDRAIADFTKAIGMDPLNTEAYSNRSHTYKLMDKPDLSRKDEEKAMSLQIK